MTALVKNITYENTDTTVPTTGARTVRFVLTDGDGGTSANYDTTVTVSAVSDAPAFGPGDGTLTTTIGAGNDEGNEVILQADGKILVAGTSHNGTNKDFTLTRYNSDGSLDTTFSGDGKLTIAIGSGDDYGTSVTVQADGKILLAGTSFDGGNGDFALVRYHSDGTLDTSFGGGDGIVTTAIGSGYDWASSVTVQADGKILAAGYGNNGIDSDFALVRYHSDGTLDTSFSADGILTIAIGAGSEDYGDSVTLQADGKILLAGTSFDGGNAVFALVRVNSDGTLDTSFGGGDGKLTTAIGAGTDYGRSVTVQADGKILVAGQSVNGSGDNDVALVRYNSDGTLDTSFGGGDGILTTAIGTGGDTGFSVTVQADGKILVAGSGHNGSNYDFAVVRYNSDGTLDTSFSGDGMLLTAIGTGDDYSYSVTVQPDGKILVAGQSYNGTNNDFALVRYNSDGSLDTSFDLATTLGGTVAFTEGGSPVVLDANVQVLDAELSAANNFSGATLTLARNGGANAQDVYSATGTLSSISAASGNVVVSGTTIGTYTNSGGTLAFTFNSNATQSLVNSAMQQIAYSNSSDAPPASAQINWTFSDGNTGSQGTGGALQATGSVTVNITPVNDAPTITNLSGDSLAYSEGAGAVVIEQSGNALVADADSTDFNTGTLTVSIPVGGDSAEDVLSIRNQGTGSGQIGVSGSNVTYEGVTIGTFTGGSGGTNLVITLNASATPTAVTALVKNITYETTDTAAPTTGARTVRYVLTDGDGGTSLNHDATITVSAANDAPVLADTALSITVVEDAGAPSGAVGSLLSAFTGGITDVDASAVKGIAVTGTNETNGTWYYTTNGGTTWTAIGSVSNTSALLLADNGSTRLYFAPSADYAGTSTAALTVRAWDQTSGSAGTKVTTASNGGTTAFSSATDTIDVSVTAQNEAPTDLSSGIELNPDGGNDAYLISDTGLSQSLTATTVEIRFAANDLPFETVLMSFNNPAGDELSIQLDDPSNNLELDFGAGTVVYASAINYRAALVDGAVHTLSVTWDSTAGNWSVYIDGSVIESGTGLSAGSTLDTTNGRFVFGQEQDGLNSGYDSTQYFSGTFYDVRIWNDVRTAGEIAQYYQQQLDVTPADAAAVGLVANWQMDGFDGSNQVVEIVSGNNLSIAHASGTGFTTGGVSAQLSIEENSANGSHVGFVTAQDPDAGETFSYSLTDSAGGRFAVNSSTGEITVANGTLLDYESSTTHNITVRVTDSGGLTYDEVLTIQVNNLEDVPINQVPGAQSTNEDTALTFNAANSNLISIADDAGETLVVTLSVNNGTMTLSRTTGLTFTAGDGTGDATMTFSGTVENINAALDGLQYNPTADYSGSDTFTITSYDQTLYSLDLDANLQARYTFDGNANDVATGTAQNGTLTNGASITTDGTRGQVLALDGVNDYVNLSAHTADFAGLTQGTISGWIKAAGTFETIFSISDTADTGSYAALFLGASGYLTYEVMENGVLQLAVYKSDVPINDGNWHHVAVSIGPSGNVLYVDGVAATSGQLTYDTGNASTQQFFSNVSGLDSMAIGRNQDSSGGKWYATGNLDDVRLYDRVLSTTEIANLANDLTLVDIDTVVITVNAQNDGPTISGLAGDSQNYAEGAGTVIIEQGFDSWVQDVDSSNFDTGSLTVSIPSGGDSAEDVLSIRHQGTAGGQIGVSGSNVSYQGVTIGTFTGGTSGSPLVVTFNSNATVAAVDALVLNMTYSNIDTDAPTTGARTVRYVLTDGDGGTSANYDTTVTVSGVNDAPVVTPVAPDVTFVEGGLAQLIDATGTIVDVDSANFDGGVLTVSISANGTADDRVIVGNWGTGPGQVGVSGSDVTYGGTVIGTVSGGTSGSDPLIITFNTSATPTAVQEVYRSIQFNNVSENPSTATRTLTIGLTDGDGGTATPEL